MQEIGIAQLLLRRTLQPWSQGRGRMGEPQVLQQDAGMNRHGPTSSTAPSTCTQASYRLSRRSTSVCGGTSATRCGVGGITDGAVASKVSSAAALYVPASSATAIAVNRAAAPYCS